MSSYSLEISAIVHIYWGQYWSSSTMYELLDTVKSMSTSNFS